MVEHWESCECRKCDQKRIADLREENARLREWKTKAIERARAEVLAEQASETLETEQARWQHAIGEKIAQFIPDVCADGCDSGDPLDWSLAEIGIALQTALETNQLEVERLREALTKIDDFPWIASDVRSIAREALRQNGGDDDE